jgi:pseudouridine synthase
MQERLQKILSRAGVASRRAAEKMIGEGRVTLNGAAVVEMGTKADPARDDIRVDGVRVGPPQRPVYLVLNKPKGVVTTRKDPEGRTTVMDLVPAVAGLFPVGRLDVNTEGVLLLTNDGDLAQHASHPRYEVQRVYQAKVRGIPDAAALARLRQGVRVEGERLAVDRVRVLEAERNAWLELALHEGRHHEVRRLLEAVGHPVSKLRRVAFGPLTLRGLEPGAFRHLTPEELRRLAGRPSSRTPRSTARRTAPERPARTRRSRGRA